MKTLRNAGRRIAKQIGLNKLTPPFARYLLTYMLFWLGGTIAGSYFNYFLLRATGGEDGLRVYNLLTACIQPFVMIPALFVLRRLSVSICMRIGLVFHALAYAVLAASGNVTTVTVYIISTMMSAGNAFIFTAYTPQWLAYTTDEGRDACYGVINMIATIVNLVLPLSIGLFISMFDDLTGYSVLFAIASLVIFGSALASFRLVPVSYGNKQEEHTLEKTAQVFFKNRKIIFSMLATMLDAMRSHGFGFFSALLVFDLVSKESTLGVLSICTTVLGLLMNVAYTRGVTPENRGRTMLLGAVGYTLAVSIVCVARSFGGYIVYSVVSTMAGVFIANPVLTGYMSAVQHDDYLSDHAAEVHVLREIFVVSGRVLGLLPAFILQDPTKYAAVMMLLYAALQIPAAILTQQMQRKVNAEEKSNISVSE